MTARGVYSFLNFAAHGFLAYIIIDAIWGADIDALDAAIATYFAVLGALFSWSMAYQLTKAD